MKDARTLLQNLVWAWDQREGVEVAHAAARAFLAIEATPPSDALREALEALVDAAASISPLIPVPSTMNTDVATFDANMKQARAALAAPAGSGAQPSDPGVMTASTASLRPSVGDIAQESGSGNRWASRRNGEQRPAVGPRESSDAVKGAEVRALDPSRVVPAVIGDTQTPDLNVEWLARAVQKVILGNVSFPMQALALADAIAAAYDAERQREKPDPLLTYTDPAGGPDWEPRRDEA